MGVQDFGKEMIRTPHPSVRVVGGVWGGGSSEAGVGTSLSNDQPCLTTRPDQNATFGGIWDVQTVFFPGTLIRQRSHHKSTFLRLHWVLGL